MICFPSHSLSLFLSPPHVCYCYCWPRCCYAHCQRVSWPGPLGATPKGVGRRTRKEQPNRTSQDRTGHRTQHSEWNGTERNRTKPRPNQSQTRPRQTEQKRTEVNTGQSSVLNVGQNFSPHTFHMNPYAKLSPPPPLFPTITTTITPRAEPILCVC